MTAIVLTPGCPAGVGPELLVHALTRLKGHKNVKLIWCASPGLLAQAAQVRGIDIEVVRRKVECVLQDADDPGIHVSYGAVTTEALAAQARYLQVAIRLLKEKKATAIVTGPVRKAALALVDQTPYAGQTELLHAYFAQDAKVPPLMCFLGNDMLLGLASVHIRIADVAAAITSTVVEQKARALINAAAVTLGLSQDQVRLTVLGLNPHAGEGGLIGDEEQNQIIPGLERLNRGKQIQGPVAADGFFASLPYLSRDELPHAVLAMYHDQGLAPFKLMCRDALANVTFGLTIKRSSPAHGTADAIAGKGIAREHSTLKAIEFVLNQA